MRSLLTRAFLTAITLVASIAIASAQTETLFDASANPQELQTFRVDGLSAQASGTVYKADSLSHGGMPLGGMGTGYITFDPTGRLGLTTALNNYPYGINPNSPFFRLQTDGQDYSIATPIGNENENCAVESVDYFGHFPVVDSRFNLSVPFGFECRAFFPLIPGDYESSNTPVVFFDVFLSNKTDESKDFRLIFGPNGFPVGEIDNYRDGDWAVFQTTHQALNTPEGTLANYALGVLGEGGKTENGVAIYEGTLAPNERRKISFLLAWYEPFIRENSGRVETNFYATRFENAKDVVRQSISQKEDWLNRVLAVQDVVYSSHYPAWLQEQLINIPTAVTKNTLWIAKTRPDDWFSSEGLPLVSESLVACPLLETLPCRYFGQWYQLFFFPKLQRLSLENTRYFQLRSGEPPFATGQFCIRDPRYHCQHTNGSGEYAQMIYHYYLRTGDREFLDDFWPSMKSAIDFMNSLDVDGDSLTEDHPHNFGSDTYPANVPMDQWPFYGVSSYTAGKCLAALEIGIQAAEIEGDLETANAWRERLEKGKKRFDAVLWNGDYYDTYVDEKSGRKNNACLSCQLSALWCVGIVGLPSPFEDDAKIQKAFDSIAKLNMHASQFGMVNAVYPDGTICYEGGIGESIWSAGNFIQCNAMTAGAFLYNGRREEGLTTIKDSLDTLFRGPIPLPWSQPCGLDMKTGGSCFGFDYLDHVICWTYPMLYDGQTIQDAVKEGGFIQSILNAAQKGNNQ